MSCTRRHTPSLASAALLFTVAWALPAQAQSIPLAIDPQDFDGPYDIWVLDEVSEALTPGPTSVEFDEIALVGYPRADRLRLDRPASVEGGELDAPRIRLPAGGALYKFHGPDSAGLLHVGADGHVDVPVQIGGGSNALLPALHVSTDGVLALVATSLVAGGDVLLLDLTQHHEPASLTAGLAPLAIEPESLRVAPGVAWFVADGQLYRSDLTTGTGALLVDLGSPAQPVHPELTAAAHDGRIAAVLGDDPALRSLVSVSATGVVTPLSSTPAAVLLPDYAHPLGPRTALSPDGAVIAWLQLEGDSLELFVEEFDQGPQALHVTDEPDFPAYIDNVGVLGFQADRRLLFLTGDTTLSGIVGFDSIGAGEMFAADLTTPGSPLYFNVSQSSGNYEPPYIDVAGLSLTDAVFDPLAQHCIISGGDGMALASFPVYGLAPYDSGVTTHLAAAEDQPELQPLGDRLLVASEPEDVDEPEGPGPEAPEIDLDLGLLNLGDPESLGLSTLLSLPDGIDVDRLVSDLDGSWTAFVATLDNDVELPVLLQVDTGQLQLPTWPWLVKTAGPLTFSSSGRLYVSVGGEAGITKFVAITPGQPPQLLATPKGRGFPLAH